MNDDPDQDGDDLAERLLRETINDLATLASTSLKDPSLSVWHHGRVLHGQLLLEQNHEPMIRLVEAICEQLQSPQIARSIFHAVNSLLTGAFKIGQGVERPLDQREFESAKKTEAGRKASVQAAGRQRRFQLISEFTNKNPNMTGSVKSILGPINAILKADGQQEIEEWSLRRDLNELKNGEKAEGESWSIADAFKPADE